MYFAPLCGCFFLNSKKAQKHFYSEDMDKLRELRKKYSFCYFRKNIGNTKLFYILRLLPHVLCGDAPSLTFRVLSDAILKIWHVWPLLLLADWFARKNLRWHSDIYNVYYYWHDSGSYNYCLDNSPPICRCTFIARQADWRAIQAQSSIHIERWP